MSETPAGIEYRTPTPADGQALSRMAAEAFEATFAGFIVDAEMPGYLERAYGRDGQMQRDLGDPAVRWRAAFLGEVPVGYVKLVPMSLPHPHASGALELRQIYVRADQKGRGVAAALMRWALDTARAAHAPEIYLAVFDSNARAGRFYARHGFAKVGRCDFRTGDQVLDDGIWRLTL